MPLSVVAPLVRKRFWFESIWRVSDPLRFKEARTAVEGVSETGGVAGTDGVTETDGVGGIDGAGGIVGAGVTAGVGGEGVGSIALSVRKYFLIPTCPDMIAGEISGVLVHVYVRFQC